MPVAKRITIAYNYDCTNTFSIYSKLADILRQTM